MRFFYRHDVKRIPIQQVAKGIIVIILNTLISTCAREEKLNNISESTEV